MLRKKQKEALREKARSQNARAGMLDRRISTKTSQRLEPGSAAMRSPLLQVNDKKPTTN